MTMGERIRYLRESKGMTQEELGEKIGVQKSAIRKYEKGEVQNIKRSNIKKLADIFGVSPTYLMCLEDEQQTAEEQNLSTEVKFLEDIQSRYGKNAVKILELFSLLNESGQKKAIEQLEMISEIPQYQKGEETK